MNGIVTLRSGIPLVIRGASNSAADRPNYLFSANLPSDQQSLTRWFNTKAFANPSLYTYGDTRESCQIFVGPRPPLAISLFFRTIPITERFKLQMRAEAFNAFNHTNYSQPDTSFTSGTFGWITSAASGRRMQVALKLIF